MTNTTFSNTEYLLPYFNRENYMKDFIDNGYAKYVCVKYKSVIKALMAYYVKYGKVALTAQEIALIDVSVPKEVMWHIMTGVDDIPYSVVIQKLKEEWVDEKRKGVMLKMAEGQPLNESIKELDALQRELAPRVYGKKSMIHENVEEMKQNIINNRTIKPLQTGWTAFDNHINGGFRKGLYYLFCGNTGSGKTRFSMALACKLLENDYSGLYFSLEMPKAEIETLYIANQTGIDIRNLDRGQVMDDILDEALGKMQAQKHRFGLIEHRAAENPPTLQFLEDNIQLHLQTNTLDFICVDYIQKMFEKGFKAEDEWRMLCKISDGLSNIAIKYDIAVLCLAQLNKVQKKGEGFDVRNIQGGYNIARSPDYVAGIMRTKAKQEINIEPDKNRKGSHDTVHFYIDWQLNRLKPDVTDSYAEQDQYRIKDKDEESPF